MGAVLFAVARRSAQPSVAPDVGVAAPSTRIVVDARVRGALAEEFKRSRSREPTQAELGALIESWIAEELLYREGLARKLDRDDPIVRQRIANKMAFVLESQVVVREPKPGELRAWFDAHRERWNVPELVDFTHVFFEGDGEEAKRKAKEALEALERGAAPGTLGERFSGGRRYRRRKLDDLAKTFGESFASEIGKQAVGGWQLRQSRFGQHVVRVDGRTAAQAASFESVELDVQKDWEASERAREQARAVEELGGRWEVVRE